jgi:hypothetical protein
MREKTFLILTILLALGIFSSSFVVLYNQARNRDYISGKYSTDTKKIDLNAIKHIIISVPFNVEIERGESDNLTLVGNNKMFDQIQTDINGDTLALNYRWFNSWMVWENSQIKLKIMLRNTETIEIRSSSNVKTNNLQGDLLTVVNKGSGDIYMVNTQVLMLRGVLWGSGDLRIGGSSQDAIIESFGSSDVDMKEFLVEHAKVDVSGSGDVVVSSKDSLDARIAGSGNIFYKNNPKINTIQIGSGKVERLN